MDVFQAPAISVTGDQMLDRKLADISGKGLFAREIHEARLDRRIDFAVRGLKDLKTELPAGIVLACTLTREDASDALILGDTCLPIDPDSPYTCLPQGAIIGTCAVRRQAQLPHARPDLRVTTIRSNVQSCLAKLRDRQYDASLLAPAGLRRLDMEPEASVVLALEIMLPAPCQGIVGITVCQNDKELRQLLVAIEGPAARAVATAGALLAALDGSCQTPIGGHAQLLPDGTLFLTGLVARPDGSFLLRCTPLRPPRREPL
jgi:hydroxymethylbilane synthase